jgi:aspartate aminotransferase
MSLVLSRRQRALRPSASIAAKARVTELRRAGRRITDFTLGEPDLDTPAHVILAAHAAARNGQTRYTSSGGTLDLRVAICEKLSRENAISCEPTQIVVGCGAKQLIGAALAATLDEGDEVIIPAPFWTSYPDIVRMCGGTPVIVSCNRTEGFKLQPEQLTAAISPRTKWLILNAPNNPTGAIYTAEELRRLIGVVLNYPNLWLMTDEIYEHFFYGDEPVHSPASLSPEICQRSLIVNGVSKTYAMTGWRIGYAAGPETLVRAITDVISQSTTCPSSVSQAAALAALSGDQTFVRDAAKLFRERRDCMVIGLNKIAGISCDLPDGAFYAFPSVAGLIGKFTPENKRLKDGSDVAAYLLDHAGVAVVDGEAYGASEFLRLSFANSLKIIEDGCGHISAACADLTTG